MNRSAIAQIATKIKKGAKFASFTYIKEDGTKSKRTVLFGAKMGAAFEKRGIEIKGTGNWHSGRENGKFKFWIKKGSERYVRGIDMSDDKIKIFKCSGISDFTCGEKNT